MLRHARRHVNSVSNDTYLYNTKSATPADVLIVITFDKEIPHRPRDILM
jgi:hypothetical protein